MFKLIAIRLFKDCIASARKCLKTGVYYYLCNDYRITDDGIGLRDKYVRPLPNDFFSISTNPKLQINISAIVGMNGDGKSTLVELIMRLINNCAKDYKLSGYNDLIRIDGIKAELFYQIDEMVYCIRETNDDSKTHLFCYANLSNSDSVFWRKIFKPVKNVKNMNDLFYTIISNYSHYAYNTYDFREEWIDKVVGEESQRCWLYYLFNKNDGYKTPLTIHPYRYEGNVDINREKELTMQRLMALYIQESKKNGDSIRKIGNKEAVFLNLTDVGYSKLQEIAILQYFKDNKVVSSLSKVIMQIDSLIEEYNDRMFENIHDDKLFLIESCLDKLTGVHEQPYKYFIDNIISWLSDKRAVFSSKSDLRQLLKVMEKFNNKYKNKYNKVLPHTLFTHKYKMYDKFNVRQLIRLRFIYDVMMALKYSTNLVVKEYSSLNDVEKCQHYIIYKIIKIFNVYPEYRDNIENVNTEWNNIAMVLNDNAISVVINRIITDKTHVTLKLKQCLNFIEQHIKGKCNPYEKLLERISLHNTADNISNDRVIRFNKIHSFYNKTPFPLDLLPPPIYKTEIIYQSEFNNGDEYIPFNYLSSGEKQLLNNVGALMYHLRNLDSVTDSGKSNENVNIILEEIELYFHPEYQRKIIKLFIEKLHDMAFNRIKRINIIFVTHSPFVLSDIPLCNVLFLKDGTPMMGQIQENTFGANIHGLLRNGFFLPSLPIGEFAYDKINGLFERLNQSMLDRTDQKQKEWFYTNITRVGEPYIREQLMKLYNMHYPN